MNERRNEQTNERTNERTNRIESNRMNGWSNAQMNEWTNGRTIDQTNTSKQTKRTNESNERRKISMRGIRIRIIIVIILIKLLIPLPTSPISLSTYIIIPIKAQNTSPMVWWWRLYTWQGCTMFTGDSNLSFPSHQLIVTYFCIGNHSIFSFQSLNWPKSSKDIPINGVLKGSTHSAGTHWAYWVINPSFPSHQQNVTQLMQRGITIFSFQHRNFPKPSADHLTHGV